MHYFTRKLYNFIPGGVKSTFLTSSSIIFLQLATGIFLARLLGPQGRGQLAICVIWPTVISSLGSLGIKDAVIFHTASKNFNNSTLFSMFSLACVQALVLMTIGFFLLPMLLTNQPLQVLTYTKYFLLIIPVQLIGSYFIAIAQGNLQITFFNSMRFLIPTTNFIVAFILFLFDIPNIIIILTGFLVGNTIVTFTYVVHTLRSYEFRFKLDIVYLKQLFTYGIKVHLGTVTHDLNQRFDQMLISVFLEPVMLGYYTVAATSANTMDIVPNSFKTILLPSVSKTQDMATAKKIISSYHFRCICIVTVCITLLYFLFPYLIPLIYGQDFMAAIPPARILLIAVLFGAIRDVLATAHRALNNPMIATKSEIIGLFITFIFLAALLPVYGVIGAAIASLLAYAAAASYNIWTMTKLYNIRFSTLFLNKRNY